MLYATVSDADVVPEPAETDNHEPPAGVVTDVTAVKDSAAPEPALLMVSWFPAGFDPPAIAVAEIVGEFVESVGGKTVIVTGTVTALFTA